MKLARLQISVRTNDRDSLRRTWVEEDDRLEAGELGVVQLNVLQRQDQLVEDAVHQAGDTVASDVQQFGLMLRLQRPVVTRYDDVTAQQQRVTKGH